MDILYHSILIPPLLIHQLVTEHGLTSAVTKRYVKLEMWANAQRDGRPAEYRWRPLINAAKFG